jgi:hypothetical protein
MAVTGQVVILVSPVFRRVYHCPALIAFTYFEEARLHGFWTYPGSLDGLHFRYGLSALLAVALHAPSWERSYRAFAAK